MARQKSLTPGDAGKASVFAEGTKGDQRAPVTPGRPVTGTISAVGDGIYTVVVDASGQVIADCHCMLGIFAGLFGYRTTIKLGLGDRVTVLPGSPSFLVAMGSRDVADTQNPDSRTHTGYPSAEAMKSRDPGRRHTPPNDLVTGEFEIANLSGMAFLAAHRMMSMKAGDLAKVEVHLLDGMVRIVSANYRHHSALGDLEIFNDGRLNCVFNGTSYPWEAWGNRTAKEPLPVELNGNQVKLDNPKDAVETGRWRFSSYVGWLGDFIHLFITDPHTAAAEIGAEGWRSGRANVHLGNDGSFLIQTCGADICLEHVVRIPVPRQRKRPNDSTGNKPDEFADLDTKWLEMWKAKPGKFHETCFQLREYTRWFSQVHALQRFRQASKDWEIPTEAETPAPAPDGHEEDRKNSIGDVEMVDSYACIRIMRDGSVVVRSASGSSITLAGDDVWISATRHLLFEAGGDIRFLAGRNVLMKARRSVEILAIKGGITLFARTWWKAFCTQGSLWLRSDAVDPTKEDAPTAEDGDPAPEVLDHAVYVHASKGRTLLRSSRELRAKIESTPDTEEATDTSASFVIESRGDIVGDAGRNLRFTTRKGFLAIIAAGAAVVKGKKFLVRAGFVDFMRSLTFKDQAWTLSKLHADSAQIRSIEGGARGFEAPEGSRVGAHSNHVGKLKDDYERPKATDEDLEELDAVETATRAPIPRTFAAGAPAWGFEIPTAYTLSGEEGYETISQQTLAGQDRVDYATWNVSADSVSGVEIDSSRGKPWGSAAMTWQHRGGDDLGTPSSTIPVSAPTSWNLRAPTFKYRKTT